MIMMCPEGGMGFLGGGEGVIVLLFMLNDTYVHIAIEINKLYAAISKPYYQCPIVTQRSYLINKNAW